MRRSWRVAAIAATAFAGSMTLNATAATAQQQGDLCALVAAYMCNENPYEFHDYDTCYRYYYYQNCHRYPDWSPTNDDGLQRPD